MPKSKKVKQEAAAAYKDLPEAELIEKLTEAGFDEGEILEVQELISPSASKAASKKVAPGGVNKLYNEIRLNKEGGKIYEGRTIRSNVKLDPERAERLNAQSHNSMIRYVPVETKSKD